MEDMTALLFGVGFVTRRILGPRKGGARRMRDVAACNLTVSYNELWDVELGDVDVLHVFMECSQGLN